MRSQVGPDQQVIETPQALGKRYWDELLELVEQGEISPALARQVRDEMFEEGAPGEAPRLRRSYWQAYLREMTGNFS